MKTDQEISFRYRPQDSATGVTRSTTQYPQVSGKVLGDDETEAIHLALHNMATHFLPQYQADDGALTKAQRERIKKSAPISRNGVVRSSLFEINGD